MTMPRPHNDHMGDNLGLNAKQNVMDIVSDQIKLYTSNRTVDDDPLVKYIGIGFASKHCLMGMHCKK